MHQEGSPTRVTSFDKLLSCKATSRMARYMIIAALCLLVFSNAAGEEGT
jgi:hypothetical protein